MDWQYLFDGACIVIGFLGGWVLKTVREEQRANTKAINDIHIEHLPKKVDKVDFTQFSATLFGKIEDLIKEVKTGNKTLNTIDKDINFKLNNVERRVAVIESENKHRRYDNGVHE